MLPSVLYCDDIHSIHFRYRLKYSQSEVLDSSRYARLLKVKVEIEQAQIVSKNNKLHSRPTLSLQSYSC
jgi:hypothetical protein